MVAPGVTAPIPSLVPATRLSDICLGVVCPMANEALNAVSFVDAVLGECSHHGLRSVTLFVVVDRVSHDETRALLEAHQARQPRLQVVWAPETRGVADAYIRGYREALDAGSDWILEIDAGFSHDPADIGRFLAAMVEGQDCVFGSRFRSGGRNLAPLRRRVVSRTGTVLANRLLGTKLTDMTSGYQLFARAALEAILAGGIRSKGPFFQTEMKAYCRHLRCAEVPITYDSGSDAVGARAIGESLVNLGELFRRRLSGGL